LYFSKKLAAPMKVLVIDDEKLDLFIASKLLQEEFEVTGFTSPNEAFAWSAANNFDVAIIDYYLDNRVLGLDVLRELRQKKGNLFKAILLTNHVEDNQAQQLKESGFDNIIYKPVSLEKVKNALK
jgi:CheY-like chemotaxis protein